MPQRRRRRERNSLIPLAVVAGTLLAPLPVTMSSRHYTLLMPAMCPSDSVRHWPVALLLAGRGGARSQTRVDARLARAHCVAKALAAARTR